MLEFNQRTNIKSQKFQTSQKNKVIAERLFIYYTSASELALMNKTTSEIIRDIF